MFSCSLVESGQIVVERDVPSDEVTVTSLPEQNTDEDDEQS